MVLITAMRNADRFRLVIPFVEFHQDRFVDGSLNVDGSFSRRAFPWVGQA